jgi:hypothetical protein
MLLAKGLTTHGLLRESMAMPSGQRNDLLWIGEEAVGLKSGPMTVTLPPNFPTRIAARVPTSLAPPRPALLTQALP